MDRPRLQLLHRVAIGLVALAVVGACSADAPTTATSPTAADPPTTSPPVVPEGYRCTEEDQAALRTVIDGVRAALQTDEDIDAPCAKGTWEARLELHSPVDPSVVADAVDDHLGPRSPDASTRDGREVWFVRCAPTLDCRVDVTPTASTDGPGSFVEVAVHAQHADHASDRQLAGDEYAALGVDRIAAAPVSDYCADTVAAIAGAGSDRAPTSFLTTKRATDPSCETVPLSFTFARPQQTVTVRFWGAAEPYELRGYDASGRLLASGAESSAPYEYDSSSTVTITAAGPSIMRVTFGLEYAVTQVTSIAFGPADEPTTVVRFDG